MCSVLAIRFVQVLYSLSYFSSPFRSRSRSIFNLHLHSPFRFRLRSRSFSAISCTVGNDSPRILASIFFCPDFPSFQSFSRLKCAWWDCFQTRVTATLLANRVVRSGCGPLFARSIRGYGLRCSMLNVDVPWWCTLQTCGQFVYCSQTYGQFVFRVWPFADVLRALFADVRTDRKVWPNYLPVTY